MHYTADRREYEAAAHRLFDAMANHVITAPDVTAYPLHDAARAHKDLEERRTTGSIILIP